MKDLDLISEGWYSNLSDSGKSRLSDYEGMSARDAAMCASAPLLSEADAVGFTGAISAPLLRDVCTHIRLSRCKIMYRMIDLVGYLDSLGWGDVEHVSANAPIRSSAIPSPSPAASGGEIVYAVGHDEFVKIGVTSNLDARVKGLQNGNPHTVNVFTYTFCGESRSRAFLLESIMHECMGQFHHRYEWFKVADGFWKQYVRSLSAYAVRIGGKAWGLARDDGGHRFRITTGLDYSTHTYQDAGPPEPK